MSNMPGAKELAINGGKPVNAKPWRDGPFHFKVELEALERVLSGPQLPLARGKWVMAYRDQLQELYGVKYAVPVSSGTAAIHVALFAAGVGADPDSGQPTFVAVDPPTDDQVQRLIEQAAHRLIALLQRRGVLDDAQVDGQTDQEPVLAAIAAASIQGLVATGERAGRRVRRVLSDPAEGIRTAPLCFASRGFSVHASTTVQAHDRAGLERLCRLC